jgi:hypothetical protein
MTEAEIGDLVLSEFSHVFRNNRGRAMAGSRVIRFGIPTPRGKKETPEDPKGGDYIGWKTVEITPEMVGQKIAVFTSIEIKTENDVIAPGQLKWARIVAENGGIAEIWQEKNGEICKKKSEF